MTMITTMMDYMDLVGFSQTCLFKSRDSDYNVTCCDGSQEASAYFFVVLYVALCADSSQPIGFD